MKIDLLDIDQVHGAMRAAASRNPMTAEYPPAWDADSIEEAAIEKKEAAVYEQLEQDPEELSELFYSGFNHELMLRFCEQLQRVKLATVTIDVEARKLKPIMDDLFVAYSEAEAKRWIEG